MENRFMDSHDKNNLSYNAPQEGSSALDVLFRILFIILCLIFGAPLLLYMAVGILFAVAGGM